MKKKVPKPKKPKTHVNKITNIGKAVKEVDFSTLQIGECFLMGGQLWMRESDTSSVASDFNQSAVNLANGIYADDLCGTMVTKVTVDIQYQIV